MSRIERFEDLQIWILSRELNRQVWNLVNSSDLSRDYALRNQINRSSGSIMDNIAEGFGRNGNKEFCQYLSISKASCYETKSQLYRCRDREYICAADFEALISKVESISGKIQAFMNYLKQSDLRGSKFK
jgi:four helix bundle protein